MSQSIYEKYGFEAISKIVHDFYSRIQRSEIAAPYFVEYNVERIINHQTELLCSILGGPANYKGRELAQAHRNLGITSEAFDEVGDLIEETLEDHGMTDDECEAIMNVINGARDVIITA